MTTIRRRPARRPEADELHQSLPPRPRRRLLTGASATLAALLACAVGFYVGVRVEKGRLPSSSGAAAAGSGAARSELAALSAARRGAGRAGSGALGGFAGAGGPGGGAAGATGGAGGAAFGTVSTIAGRTLYVTEPSGNTVAVKLTGVTKITKTRSARRAAIRPGDSVVAAGVPGRGGAVTAASVTDSGASPIASSTSGAGSSGSASAGGAGGASANSAVGSLFAPGK